MLHEPLTEANLLAYHRLRSAIFDIIIWCLGPLVDESRPFSVGRRWLARVTCMVCRPYFSRLAKSDSNVAR